MEVIELKASVRSKTGNGPARVLRRAGSIPAVLYGPGVDPLLLSVNTKEFEDALRHQNISQAILNLIIQNGKRQSRSVMIKEIQKEPVSNSLLHIDFYEIAMDRRIDVMVPVVIVGKAAGVERGGLLQVIRREIEVNCLPGQIPESIEVDVSHLDIGDSMHVEDIPLGSDVELLADVNFTVVTVVSPKIEEEVEEELEGEEEEAAAEEEETPETSEEE